MDGTAPGIGSRTAEVEGPLLTKAQYQELRSHLDFRPKFIPNLLIICVDAVLLTLAVSLLRAGGWSALIAQPLLALVFFNAFSLLHECGHASASSSSFVNVVLGHLASTFCFIPFYPWKYIHQRHHSWTGNIDRDPVLRSVRKWRDNGVPAIVRLSWRSWIPLGALLQHAVYAGYPLQMWRAKELAGRKLLRVSISLAWMPLSYFLLYELVPDVMQFSRLWPALALFLVAEELVNIPHHVDTPTFTTKLPVWEQYRASRSCYYPRGLSELLVLNFNFHTEHHLFPSLPWYRLRRARDIVRGVLADRYREAIGVQWNLENRSISLQEIVKKYAQNSSPS